MALLNLLNFKQHAEHRKSFTKLLMPVYDADISAYALFICLGMLYFLLSMFLCLCVSVSERELRERDLYAVDLHVKNKGKIVTQIIFNKAVEMWAIVRFVENNLDFFNSIFRPPLYLCFSFRQSRSIFSTTLHYVCVP